MQGAFLARHEQETENIEEVAMKKLRGEFLYDPEDGSIIASHGSKRVCPKCGNDDQRYFREVEVVDDQGETVEDAWMCLDCGCINMSSEVAV